MWPASVPANTSSSSTKQTTALPLRQPDWQLLPLLLQIPARLLLQLVRNRRIRQSESLKRAAQAQAAEHARSDEHEIVETRQLSLCLRTVKGCLNIMCVRLRI
jgi:hypothetical protein